MFLFKSIFVQEDEKIFKKTIFKSREKPEMVSCEWLTAREKKIYQSDIVNIIKIRKIKKNYHVGKLEKHMTQKN